RQKNSLRVRAMLGLLYYRCTWYCDDVNSKYTAVWTRSRRLASFEAGILATAVMTAWRISLDIVPWKSRALSVSMRSLGSSARGIHAERSMDVPLGRFGGAAGIVEKITRLTKLSRRKAVRDEKSTNCGPSTLSPGTLAVGG